MFRKSSTVFLVLILSLALAVPALAAPLTAATTVPGGNVSGTWDMAGSPYLVNGNITVPAGGTLTIEPGVQVIFQSWYSLTVNGTLNADGTASDPILFTAATSPGWLGIRFISADDSSSLTYAIVEKGHATGADPLNNGGGIYIDSSSPTISHSTIRNNLAKISGGGIYLTNSNATLVGNTIINNQAGQGGTSNGGGLAVWYSNPTLTGNVISGNSVYISGGYTTPSGYGGGLFLRSSNAILTGNLISDNHVNASLNSNARGAGLYLYYGSPNFINNTITGNTIENISTGYYAVKEGGAIYSYYSQPTFVNTILWNDAPQEIFVANYGYPNSTLTFAYSDLQGGQAGIASGNLATINWEQGNVDRDPRFVDPALGDFSLQSNSQLIDAGTAYFEWNGTVLVNLSSSEYNGSAPDMGAFEFGNGGSPNQPPVAVAAVTPDHGSAPLTVQFSSADSYDPDGIISATSWDFGDGSSSNEANPSHTYTSVNTFQATLTVTDNNGATHTDTVSVNVQDGTTIYAGNVSGTWNAAGSPYRIEGNITVPAGATLTIEAGTEVSFQSWYSLTVNGTLLANGTASQPILFTAVTSPGWLGIRFVSAPDGSLLDHVIVEKGRATGASPLDSGGGIYIDGSNPTISNSIIRNNLALNSGGGIYLNNSNATLIGNSIINNQAGQGGTSNGGGLAVWYSNPAITNNVISGNSVYISGGYTTPSGYGGGLFLRSSDAVLTGNLISDNHVNAALNSNARGGALYLYYGSPVFINNTITGNSLENTSTGYYAVREGGGIYTLNSNPTFVNTILWNDTPQELFANDYGVNSTYTFAYSDVQGGQAGIVTNNSVIVNWVAGNIDNDPRFTDSASGDFSLQSNSPAVDAGTAYFEWNGNVLVNLASGEYNGNAPDMGAFESTYTGGSGGNNQPPVAVAAANPESGTAPLTVQFSSAGSSDPDGTITAFTWDFGDGGTSNAANPSYTYANAGTYNAVLTVTDDGGATASATVTIDVAQASQNELHVQAQSVTREQLTRRYYRGVDTILIADQNNQPVAGVSVTVNYSGPSQGQTSGVTGADGTVTLTTNWQRNPKGNWCFEVTDVAKDGYNYNASANVVTMQCE
jgi:PKD repeat protein